MKLYLGVAVFRLCAAKKKKKKKKRLPNDLWWMEQDLIENDGPARSSYSNHDTGQESTEIDVGMRLKDQRAGVDRPQAMFLGFYEPTRGSWQP
ncbi:hypothetical protein DFQ29_005746 [Apophysomyces sp. BC1021]|nr:hypothetical protein DFQ29_005746 [Apophysomyces sp. BC1021]